MKKILLSIILISFNIGLNAQNVNIPDANFKAYLVADPAINLNMDSEIQVTEANAFAGTINCNFLNIMDLTGLEAFTSLTQLILVYNPFTSIDISQNTNLLVLHVYINELTSLDVSNNVLLTELRCERNPIMNLDVSNLPNLTLLTCGNAGLTSLDISNNPNLDLLDISGNAVFGDMNQITSLDVSNNVALTVLSTGENPINSLDVSNNVNLQTLYCTTNGLTTLDVSMLANLTYLACNNNSLTSLDVSNNLAMTDLYIGTNPLIGTIDVSTLPALKAFECSSTQISGLSVANGNNTNFTAMWAYDNPNLTCVEVDDAAWSTANWNAWNNIDPTASYSEDCLLSVSDLKTNAMTLSPNPAKTFFNIESEEKIEKVFIYSMKGSLLKTETGNTVNIESFPAGMYMIRIQTANSLVSIRFVKE